MINSTLIAFTILGGIALIGYAHQKIRDIKSRSSKLAKIYPNGTVNYHNSKKLGHQKVEN